MALALDVALESGAKAAADRSARPLIGPLAGRWPDLLTSTQHR